jgi:hypothetical protein
LSRALVISALSALAAACVAEPVKVAEPDFDSRMRAVIRDQAQRDYAGECGRVSLPDNAIFPLELTGGGPPEYAVTFGRVLCESDGGRTTRFSGTGGPLMQFWIGSGGPPRIMLEQPMFGFSTGQARLIAYQHGSFCPDGTGPNMCRITYVWNDKERRLVAAEHRYFDGGEDPPPVEYDALQLPG